MLNLERGNIMLYGLYRLAYFGSSACFLKKQKV